MFKFFVRCALLGLVFAWSTNTFAQNGTLKGYAFGDIYYVAQNGDADLEGQNGLWFRRVYFTYDDKIDDSFSIRFRLELNSEGDFSSSSKLSPVLKDGYLRWQNAKHSIFLGLSPSPTWNYVESIWGYRSVEKTPADLYKFGSSRDIGLAAKGTLDQDKKIRYHIMVANGNSNGSENNKGKKVMLSLGTDVAPDVSVEVYGDFERRNDDLNRITAQGFLGVSKENYRFGAQYLHQTRETLAGVDEELQVISAFITAKLKPKMWGFLRFDRSMDPLSAGPGLDYLPIDPGAKFNFLLAGLDISPHPQVHFMPNIEMVAYSNTDGYKPDSFIMPRFSFYYIWK